MGISLLKIEIAPGTTGYIVHQGFSVVTSGDLGKRFAAKSHLDIRLVIDGKADNEVIAAELPESE